MIAGQEPGEEQSNEELRLLARSPGPLDFTLSE